MDVGAPRAGRRAARLTALVVLTVAALGGPLPPAQGSCAGPQLTVVGVPTAGSTVVAARGELLLVQVRRGQAFRVEVTNVNDPASGCGDTSGGCADPGPAAPLPARGIVLVLEQGNRRWTFGPADATGPQRSVVYDVVLPRALRRAGAELLLVGPVIGEGPQLHLVVE